MNIDRISGLEEVRSVAGADIYLKSIKGYQAIDRVGLPVYGSLGGGMVSLLPKVENSEQLFLNAAQGVATGLLVGCVTLAVKELYEAVKINQARKTMKRVQEAVFAINL